MLPSFGAEGACWQRPAPPGPPGEERFRRHVGIINVRPVGNYAIQNAGIPHARRIEFDDLHDTGIYSWDYLHHLGSNKFALMKHPGNLRYLRRLQAAGKSREPATRTRRTSRPPATTTSAPAAPAQV
ncbi:uncharacterized protein ACA1_053380 [Acanthamoeba castellanii str. Neff]|uniref:Gamma-butyrobetaine hydroxylase-like N-terminal domain-containing protein n=1 Tax=Acanthamoeba castellanii (strain ATCC 30010 / Neff) TaxID=1257118 RepID=L8H662_ACACF|nr:uncharacterized protein ACA1_053380 [Acanthamoeba castellanii str. Neff]ELR20615.1 hypothetical protein ACA1_053380 [Acanthamoeba castellanii str. Neff]